MNAPKRAALAAASILALAIAATPSQAQELRIGFINSDTGPALIGGHLQWLDARPRTSGLEADGDKLGGVPTKIFYGDDQSAKVDASLKEADKMIKQDKVRSSPASSGPT